MPYFINNLNQKIAYKYYRGKSPGIIFIHGLSSDMEGGKALHIEKYAKLNKINFIKFDCRGHGKSFGKFEDFTIENWKKDLLDILDNIAKGPQILVGSSMGGWLMLLAALKRKSKIHSLIGLAAAPDFTKYMFRNFPKKNKNDLKKLGITSVKLGDYKYTFKKKFFAEGNKNLVLNKQINFNKTMILIHGLKDLTVPHNEAIKILKKTNSKNIQIRYLKDSDHSLSSTSDLKVIINAINEIRAKK